jgi:hypothetical protein
VGGSTIEGGGPFTLTGVVMPLLPAPPGKVTGVASLPPAAATPISGPGAGPIAVSPEPLTTPVQAAGKSSGSVSIAREITRNVMKRLIWDAGASPVALLAIHGEQLGVTVSSASKCFEKRILPARVDCLDPKSAVHPTVIDPARTRVF